MKANLFEYIVYLLICWYKERRGISSDSAFNNDNDISKLKVLKLLFFVVAVNGDKNSLLEVFTFYALPYGHVEDDIYNLIDGVDGQELQRYTIDTSKTIIKESYIEQLLGSFHEDIQSLHYIEAKAAVEKLRDINPNLIEEEAFDLVEISHLWFSWRSTFAYARAIGRFKEKILVSLIKQDNKIFSLS